MLSKSVLLTMVVLLCIGFVVATAQAKDQDRTRDKDQDRLKTCDQFVDLNGDGICDNCTCIDADGDGVCDLCPCGAQTRKGR